MQDEFVKFVILGVGFALGGRLMAGLEWLALWWWRRTGFIEGYRGD